MDIILGADPGKNGAIALIQKSDGKILTVIKFRDDPYALDMAIRLYIRPYMFDGSSVKGYLENVHSSSQMGVASSFSFGRVFGMLHQALVSVGIGITLVTPQVWQRNLNCLSKGDKNVTKEKAKSLWPLYRVTHTNADALLIAEYGRRVEKLKG